ncbi:STT3 domain-containing protein, partial [Chloroflexota bacterium]
MSNIQEPKESRFSPKLLAGIILALLFGIALYLRVSLPYDKVFTGEWIKFTGIDVYYHIRLVDNLVHNFPHYMSIDPYFLYPGATTGEIQIRFFDWLLASLIWLIGLGSPTEHTVDVVGVYYPAVLGALTVIPVYFIGKVLFNNWAGIASAGLIALLPGEFMGRSILGFADHDVANTLFTTVSILFLLLAINTAKQRQLTFKHINRQDWSVATKPLIYSLLAGIFLGMYLLMWMGALLFVFILTVYFIIQFIIDHLKRQSTGYLCLIGIPLFFAALLVFLPMSPGWVHLASLVIAILIPLVMSGTSWFMARSQIKPVYYPLTVVG